MRIFGHEYSKDELRQRIGDITQIAGIKPYVLDDGYAQGVKAFDVKTGSGFYFTVLPGRALDIAWMEHNGRPAGYIGKGGITHPSYYASYGYEWLRSFYAGVLTTCGLINSGPPEKEGIWDLGLHGRISNTPAVEVSHKTRWEDNDLVMEIKGSMRETSLFYENLLLTRTITAKGGENKLIIHDRVENQGYESIDFMLLYHVNLGFPIVDDGSSFIAPVVNTRARDAEAEKGIENYKTFEKPIPGYKEQVFFHKLASDDNGMTLAGIINEQMNIGFYMHYNTRELPFLTEWKMMGQQDYVVGVEPGNCLPIGRKASKEKGWLDTLKPQESKTFTLEMGMMTTWKEIEECKNHCDKLLKQKKELF